MKLLIVLAVAFALAYGQESSGPEVETFFGKVRGSMGESRDGRMYYSFTSIPYAQAERFQPPEIPDNWDDVKDASKPAPPCIQYDPFKKAVVGQEDCLNLNVFTPRLPKEGQDKVLLPVVVYLHPGLHDFGSSEDYNPRYIMDGDVILVIPNTRQGIFGFLNTGDILNAAGNQGLRDQVQVLKWIKQNIENFGGDKDRVTVAGSVTGGSDAFLHTLSPQSKGLIHNVISMGGTPLSRFSMIRNPVKQAKKVGKQLGCPTDSSAVLVTCLRGMDAKEMLEKMTKIDLDNINAEDILGKAYFGPTIDTLAEGQTEQDLVIPEHPYKLLAEGKIVNKVPLIIGANEFDGVTPISAAFLKEEKLMEKLDKQWDEIAPTLFLYHDTASDKEVVSSKIRQFYFGDKAINKESFMNLSYVFMDRFTGFPSVVAAKLYSKAAPVYLYYFSHKPTTTLLQFLGIDDEKYNYGMSHLDDVQYFFKVNVENKGKTFPEITKDSTEYELSKGLIKLFGSFIENGKPTKTWGEGKEWKKNEAGEVSNWYKIGPVTELQNPAPEMFTERIKFWSDISGKELAKEMQTPEVDTF